MPNSNSGTIQFIASARLRAAEMQEPTPGMQAGGGPWEVRDPEQPEANAQCCEQMQ